MIYLGSDHAGFHMKEHVKTILKDLEYGFEDLGPFKLNEKDDYPDFILPVAKKVAKDAPASKGIILGFSGQGEAMVANRVKGVRAVVIYNFNKDIVRLSREHNDSNILSLSARFLPEDEVKEVVKMWLETPFSGDDRHVRRIRKFN